MVLKLLSVALLVAVCAANKCKETQSILAGPSTNCEACKSSRPTHVLPHTALSLDEAAVAVSCAGSNVDEKLTRGRPTTRYPGVACPTRVTD